MVEQVLKGKVAIVTGASRGLGAEIGRQLAGEGIKVALVARNETRLAEVKKEIINHGGEAQYFPCDITQKSQVINAVREVVKLWGTVDILVNNAGIGHWATVLDMTEEQWDEIMAINLKGVFLITQATLPYLISHKAGDIINISSVMGHSGAPNLSGYCTSKFGLEGFAKSLYEEVKPFGIRVNNVSPAMIDTEFRDHMEGRRPYTKEELSRMLTKGDVASAVLFILKCSENAQITNLFMRLNRF